MPCIHPSTTTRQNEILYARAKAAHTPSDSSAQPLIDSTSIENIEWIYVHNPTAMIVVYECTMCFCAFPGLDLSSSDTF